MHTRPLVVSVLLASLASVAHGQIIANGSLTGAPGAGVTPPGWIALEGSPDIADALGPFNNTGTAWILSPDGGTFVRAIGSVPGSSEGIEVGLVGTVSGQAYQIDFYQTNLGFLETSAFSWLGTDGYFELLIDGVVVDTSSVSSKPVLFSDTITWNAESVTFVASSGFHEIGFRARTADPLGPVAYMGIDGIRLSQIPAPGVLASLGVLGVLSRRRRG
ncbi:MAG: hypothetical protein AAGB51_09700 [Planctomycetota bacterium]